MVDGRVIYCVAVLIGDEDSLEWYWRWYLDVGDRKNFRKTAGGIVGDRREDLYPEDNLQLFRPHATSLPK